MSDAAVSIQRHYRGFAARREYGEVLEVTFRTLSMFMR